MGMTEDDGTMDCYCGKEDSTRVTIPPLVDGKYDNTTKQCHVCEVDYRFHHKCALKWWLRFGKAKLQFTAIKFLNTKFPFYCPECYDLNRLCECGKEHSGLEYGCIALSCSGGHWCYYLKKCLRKNYGVVPKRKDFICLFHIQKIQDDETVEDMSERHMVTLKCDGQTSYVNYLDEDTVLFNLQDGNNIGSSVMQSYLNMIIHDKKRHAQKNMVLLPYIWCTRIEEVYLSGENPDSVVCIVSDQKSHYGVLHYTTTKTTIYDGSPNALAKEYIKCYEEIHIAMTGQKIQSDVTIAITKKLPPEKLPANMDKHTLVRAYCFEQPYGTKSCGAIACVVCKKLLHDESIPNEVECVSRELVLDDLLSLCWQYRDDLYDDDDVKIMDSVKEKHFIEDDVKIMDSVKEKDFFEKSVNAPKYLMENLKLRAVEREKKKTDTLMEPGVDGPPHGNTLRENNDLTDGNALELGRIRRPEVKKRHRNRVSSSATHPLFYKNIFSKIVDGLIKDFDELILSVYQNDYLPPDTTEESRRQANLSMGLIDHLSWNQSIFPNDLGVEVTKIGVKRLFGSAGGGDLNDETLNLIVHICNYYACAKIRSSNIQTHTLPDYVSLPSYVTQNVQRYVDGMVDDPLEITDDFKAARFSHACEVWYSQSGKNYLTTVLDEYDDANQIPKGIIIPLNIRRLGHWMHLTAKLGRGYDGLVESVDYLYDADVSYKLLEISKHRMLLAKFLGMYMQERDGVEAIYCGHEDMFLDVPQQRPDTKDTTNSFNHRTNIDEKSAQKDDYNCGMFVAHSIVHTIVGNTCSPLEPTMLTPEKLILLRNNWVLLIVKLALATNDGRIRHPEPAGPPELLSSNDGLILQTKPGSSPEHNWTLASNDRNFDGRIRHPALASNHRNFLQLTPASPPELISVSTTDEIIPHTPEFPSISTSFNTEFVSTTFTYPKLNTDGQMEFALGVVDRLESISLSDDDTRQLIMSSTPKEHKFSPPRPHSMSSTDSEQELIGYSR